MNSVIYWSIYAVIVYFSVGNVRQNILHLNAEVYLLFPLAWYISVALHEFGHALGCFFAHIPVSKVRLGPLNIVFGNHSIRQLKLDFSPLNFFSGICQIDSQGKMYDWKAYFYYIVAGPLLSALFAILSLLLISAAGLTPSLKSFASLIFICAVIHFLEVLPKSRSIFPLSAGKLNDGTLLLWLLGGHKTMKSGILSIITSTRLSDLDRVLLNRRDFHSADGFDGFDRDVLSAYVLDFYMRRGEYTSVSNHLERISDLGSKHKSMQMAILGEYICLASFIQLPVPDISHKIKEFKVILTELKQTGQVASESVYEYRMLTHIHLHLGEPEKSAEFLRKALGLNAKQQSELLKDIEAERLRRLEGLISHASGSSIPAVAQ